MSRVAHEGAAVEVALDAPAVLAERVEILTIFYIQDLVDTLEPFAKLPALLVGNAPMITLLSLLLRGSMRPSEIAGATHMSSGGVTALLERLERFGLVSRKFGRVPGDRRAVVVELTNDGRDLAAQLAESMVAPTERMLHDLAALADGDVAAADEAQPAAPAESAAARANLPATRPPGRSSPRRARPPPRRQPGPA